jgi:hypothetical protein
LGALTPLSFPCFYSSNASVCVVVRKRIEFLLSSNSPKLRRNSTITSRQWFQSRIIISLFLSKVNHWRRSRYRMTGCRVNSVDLGKGASKYIFEHIVTVLSQLHGDSEETVTSQKCRGFDRPTHKCIYIHVSCGYLFYLYGCVGFNPR